MDGMFFPVTTLKWRWAMQLFLFCILFFFFVSEWWRATLAYLLILCLCEYFYFESEINKISPFSTDNLFQYFVCARGVSVSQYSFMNGNKFSLQGIAIVQRPMLRQCYGLLRFTTRRLWTCRQRDSRLTFEGKPFGSTAQLQRMEPGTYSGPANLKNTRNNSRTPGIDRAHIYRATTLRSPAPIPISIGRGGFLQPLDWSNHGSM